jgi:hypothetical protein
MGVGQPPDAAIAELAARQAGCLSRTQGLEVGLTDSMIRRRVGAGRWRRAHPGVYTINGAPPSWLQGVWAAVLAAGPHAVASHATSLIAHGLADHLVPRHPVHLSIPRGQRRRVNGVVIHQITDLTPDDKVTVGGIPVTTPARAVVELAALVGRQHLGRVVDDVVPGLTTLPKLASCLAELARPGKAGVAKLGLVLDERQPGRTPTTNMLERRLRALLVSHGLPEPVAQYPLPGAWPLEGLVDFAYPDARMILEADGRRWHTRVADLRRDHEREAQASQAGWVTVRFLYEQIIGTPDDVARTVAAIRRTRLAQLG